MSQKLDHKQLASLLRECATIIERNESSALLYTAVEALNSYAEQNKHNGDGHSNGSGHHLQRNKSNPSSPRQERPCFQRPVNKSSNLIANGWVEQQRRSKLRIVWKEVLVSLVEARRPGEETTLWIQREMHTDDGKACLEALHQIPMKWLLGVKFVDIYGDFRLALRIHEVPDEFVFRTKDEESCKEWVATLKSAREASANNTKKENGANFPDLLNKDEASNGKNDGIFPDLDLQTGAPTSGGSMHSSVSASSSRTASSPAPISAPLPAPDQKKERKSIKELRAIAHGAGYNTRGMERSDLEKIAEYYAPVSEQQARQQKMAGQTQPANNNTPTSAGTNHSNHKGSSGGDTDNDRERQRKAQEAERMKRQKEEEERQRMQQQQEYIKQKREEEYKRQQAAAEKERERLRQQQQQQQWNSGQQWNNTHHHPHTQQSNNVENLFESTRFFESTGGGVGGPRRKQPEPGVGGPRRKQPEPPVPPSAPPMPNTHQQQQYQQQQQQYQSYQQSHFQQQQQQQQHQRYHPYQQQAPPPQPPHQSPPPVNPAASNPPPPQPQPQPQPRQQQSSPPPQTRSSDPTSPLNQKYAKAMSAQKLETQNSNDQDEAAIAMIKRSILIHWALVPPQYNMLRPIDQLLTNIQTVFPPFGNVARHEYFAKWKVVKREDLVLSPAMGGAPDETKLKKAHRKLRVFLHPDRLPREFDANQTFVCKMLWDVSNDAWEEFLKQKDDLDWVHQS